MEIMSIGEKIKMLRKKVGLRQDELTDDLITRSLVSMLESDKRNLNKKTAAIIASKLNVYYETLGQEITAEYLLESKEIQASKMIDGYIEEMYQLLYDKKNNHERRVNEVLLKAKKLATTWGLENKLSEIYFFEGEYDCELEKYNRAIMSFFNALEHRLESKEYESISEVFMNLSKCYAELEQFQEAIEYSQKAVDVLLKNDTTSSNEIETMHPLNLIVYYTKTKQFDAVLSSTSALKNVGNVSQSAVLKATIYEANASRNIKNYEKTQRIYEKLLNKEHKLDLEMLARIYLGKSQLFVSIAETQKALESCNESFRITEKIGDAVSSKFLLEIAKQYFELGKFEIALDVLGVAQKKAEEHYKLKEQFEVFIFRAEVFKKQNDFSKAETYLLQAEKMTSEENIKFNLTRLYSLYSELHFEMGNMDKCMLYLKKIRKC